MSPKTPIRREHLPPVHAGPGLYAVDDPDRPGRLTAWSVDHHGVLHRYPPGGPRWEPRCPDFADITTRDERREERDHWYATVYYPWKRRLVAAINADPAAACRAFIRAYPAEIVAHLNRARVERERHRHRATEELLAAGYIAGGTSMRQVAARLGVARGTAKARGEAGRLAWAADPAGARALLVDRYRPVLGDAVGAFVDRLGALMLGEQGG